MGLINAFIDCLDKKWGEQAMQRALDEKDRAIEEKDRAIEEKDRAIEEKDRRIAEQDRAIEEKKRAIAEKDRAIEDRKRTIETLRENRARADAAWERAVAERTRGTVRTSPPIC